VAVVDDHACAYVQPSNQPGQNFCWGENGAGQLGDGTTTSSQVAVGVVGIPSDEILFVGPYFNCSTLAVLDAGDLWCWGLNRNGQLGDGTTNSPARPEQLMVDQFRSLDIFGQFVLASRTDGAVLCWGTGYCGDGAASTVARLSPTPVMLPQGGPYQPVGGSQGICTAGPDQSILCWGSNQHGQVGDGTFTERLTPTSTGVTWELSYRVYGNADGSSFYVVAKYGWVYAWGQNDKGQLGDGTPTDRNTPTRIPGLTDVDQIVTGAAHACSVTSTGVVQCWGANESGQLGDGTFVNRSSPVTVTF
jgi:alpha-tubulin suppressor-like RCC1 family protein